MTHTNLQTCHVHCVWCFSFFGFGQILREIETGFFLLNYVDTLQCIIKFSAKQRCCICSFAMSSLIINSCKGGLCLYLFKSDSSQLSSHWESAEPVFCSEELNSLPCKIQNKSLNLSHFVGKFKFAVSLLTSYAQAFIPMGHL